MHVVAFEWAALVLTAFSSYFDWRSRRIPNWLALGFLPCAPVGWALAARHAQGGCGLSGPLLFASLSLVGAVLCALAPFLLFRFSMMGGGDVKVLASVGALATAHGGIPIELLAFALAIVVLPARLAFRGTLVSTLARAWGWGWRLLVVLRGRGSPPLDSSGTRFPAELTDRVRFIPFVFTAVLLSTFLPGVWQ